MTRLAVLIVAIVLAAPSFALDPSSQAERERKVKVALALAHVEPVKTAAAVPVKAVFDWFGDEPALAAKAVCPCGPDCKCAPGSCPANCPATAKVANSLAKAEPVKYRTEYRQECSTDRFGRRSCQWVEYHVPINP